MAVKALIGKTCTNKAGFFRYFRDFLTSQNGIEDFSLTGLGWTLIDSSYAVDAANPQSGDWFAVKSHGEDCKDDLFFKFSWSNTSYIYVEQFLGWNDVTHAGVNACGQHSGIVVTDASTDVSFYMFGNKDYFIPVFYVSSKWYGMYHGKLDAFYDDTIAVCSSDLTAGSDVSITVDAVPASWEVGGKIMIKDQADIEIITIKTLVGNTITADLTKSYTANVKLAQVFEHAMSSGTTFINNTYTVISHSGTRNPYASFFYVDAATRVDPDPIKNEYIGFKITLVTTDAYCGSMKGVAMCGAGDLSDGDALTARDSTQWRYFSLYSGAEVLIQES